jgi:hypothetical protein
MLAGAVVLLLGTTANADNWFVDHTRSGTAGTSWTTAFPTLEEGLAAASAGDTVFVADGTYTPDDLSGSGDRDQSFIIPDGVKVEGGYEGFGESSSMNRDVNVFVTVLSGDFDGDDGASFTNREDNAYHVVIAADIDNDVADTILDGFTITGGMADNDEEDTSPPTGLPGFHRFNGGGLYAINSRLIIIRCTFVDNAAVDEADHGIGGGAYVTINETSPIEGDERTRFINCVFTANQANRGSALAVQGLLQDTDEDAPISTKATLTNCLIYENHSDFPGEEPQAGSDGSAAAFLHQQVLVTFESCTIADNTAENEMGGVLAELVKEPGCESGTPPECLPDYSEAGVTMYNTIVYYNRGPSPSTDKK